MFLEENMNMKTKETEHVLQTNVELEDKLKVNIYFFIVYNRIFLIITILIHFRKWNKINNNNYLY